MPRNQQIITAFKNGEVSPTLGGRVETDQYPYFVETLENLYVHKHGGVFTRPGLHFVLETKFPQKISRLIPFVFSQSESYMLEMGDRYMRVFRNSGYLENLNAVETYIGDGSSTYYHYQHPEVAEADVLVLLNGEEQTITTKYTIAETNLVDNQMDDFTVTASWDTNFDDGGTATDPWVLNLNTATSPVGSNPVLRQSDIQLGRGAVVDFTVGIDAYSYEETVYQDTLAAAQELSTVYTTVGSVTLTESGKQIDIDINGTADIQPQKTDTISVRVSYIRASESAVTIYEDTKLISAAGAFTHSFSFTDVELLADDEIRIEWKVLDGTVGVEILTQIIDVVAIIDPDAKLNIKFVNATDDEDLITHDPADGAYSLSGANVQNSYPLRIKFFTDRGLNLTLSDPSVVNTSAGYTIIFVTAPSISDVVTILDGGAVPDGVSVDAGGEASRQIGLTDASAPAPLALNDTIYEIESPFLEEELEDLYYVQANDVLVVCHYAHKPWRLTRYNSYDWRWEQPEFKGAPWEDAQYSPVNGYPRVVTFFQERLWFAATLEFPQTFWGSRSADFYEFTLPAEEDVYKPDDPVEYVLASYTQEQIEWFSSERILIIGTAATENRLDPDQYIAADRLPKVSKMTSYGGAHQIPIYMGNLTCFVHASGKQLRSFKQDGQSIIEAYSSIDMGWLAEHMFEIPFKQPCYQLIPDAVALMVRLDGVMLAAAYDPTSAEGNQNDVGWSRLITQGNFESVAVIPDYFVDQTWTIAERTIDDLENPIYDENEPPNIIGYEQISNRYVEFMSHERRLDSYLTYPPERDFSPDDGPYPPIQDVGNLEHLEGKTVGVIVDGALHPDRVVENGQIRLDRASSDIAVGLKYNQKLKCMPYEGGNPGGTSQGQRKRWIEIWAKLVDSANPIINGKRPASRSPSTPMDTREPNKTGQVRSINVGFDRTGQIEIEQDLPLSLHLVALFGDYEVHSG